MIRLLGIGVVFSVFFLVQRILYQRFWLQHLTAQVRFVQDLSLITISEPTRQAEITYAVFCLQ